FEVFHQRCRWLIGFAATVGEVALDTLVVIPDLAVDEELHETHAALHQTPRNQTTCAVFTSDRIVEAIKLPRRFAFAGNIERLFRGRLHAGGQFVAGDARFEIALAGMPREMITIQLGQEREVLFLQLALQVRRRFEIQDAWLARTHYRALKERRHPAI